VLVAPPGRGRLVGVDVHDRTCPVCGQGPPGPRFIYCSRKCKWTAANRKRYKRPTRTCPGCAVDISDQHGRVKFCSNACGRWVAHGHTDLRVRALSCVTCGRAMADKRASAKFCGRACKARASEQRRERDDGARYLRERARRMTYALEYARRNPHVAQAAKVRRRAQKRDAGVFRVTGKDWLRLCNRHGNRCFYCHQRRPLTMDHVIPLSRGGRHSIGNLLPACASCNASKSARFLTEWRRVRTH
jgi:5-methylcytosine-specific restriction endonuclease McrA